jgi:hypothetical protein
MPIQTKGNQTKENRTEIVRSVTKEKSGSDMFDVRTGALGLKGMFFDLFLLQRIPNGQLTRHIRIYSFTESPRS